MDKSLAHSKWICKYHIIFTPKYRRKIIYNKVRKDLQECIRKLCKYKGVEIIEGSLMPDYVHLLLSIPPKYSVAVSYTHLDVYKRQPQAAAVAARKQFFLAVFAAPPDWAGRMDYIARGQAVALCDFGLPGFAPMERAAFRKQRRPRRAVDCAVYAAPAQQGGVCRVYYRVPFEFCDIAGHNMVIHRKAPFIHRGPPG